VPPAMTLVIHTAGDPLLLVHPVQNGIWAVDKHQPVFKVRSTRQLFSETLSKQRFETFLLVSFALIALSLACAGVYAVTAYSATQRRLEMGIRIAFGAERRSLLTLMMKDALTSTFWGISGGLVASLVVSRYMQSELYQVKGTSPAILIGTSVIMLIMAALASFLPAHRASVVDPMRVLRQE
jgi:putative ABC transport system permease protein